MSRKTSAVTLKRRFYQRHCFLGDISLGDAIRYQTKQNKTHMRLDRTPSYRPQKLWSDTWAGSPSPEVCSRPHGRCPGTPRPSRGSGASATPAAPFLLTSSEGTRSGWRRAACRLVVGGGSSRQLKMPPGISRRVFVESVHWSWSTMEWKGIKVKWPMFYL